MKKLLLFISVLFVFGTTKAQDYHWSYDYHQWDNVCTIIGEVFINGEILSSSDYELAAFVNNEVRGTEYLLNVDSDDPDHYYAWFGISFSTAGETVTFKLYDHATGNEYDNCSTSITTNQDGYGEETNPLAIEFTADIPISFGPNYPWVVVGGFENYMYLETQIQIDGVPVTTTSWEVGAFCGDECRGLGAGDKWWESPIDHSNILEIVVGGASGDVINFYLYDSINSQIFPGICTVTLDWEDGDIGDMMEPFILNFVTEQTFTKYIAAYTPGERDHYYLIASPIGDVSPEQVTHMLENNYDLYYFDEAGDTIGNEWINYKAGAFNLVSGKGYLYANNMNDTLTFTGFPYSGDGVVTLTKTDGGDFPGWNLVGNPFAQTAYIPKDFYVMNSEGTELEGVTAGAPIQAMEGIFVIADNNNEDLTFSTEQPPQGKSANLVINVSHGCRSAAIDRAIVRFGDKGMLPKFMLNEDNTKLYIPQDGRDYAIVSAENHGEIPLNFKARQNDSYTLLVSTENADFSYLHLIDNKTGNDIDLLVNPSYSFDARYTDYASRFKIVFSKIDDGTDDDFAFINGDNIIINGQGTVQVIDALGRILSSHGNNVRTISTNGMAAGVYVLRLINGNESKTQKIIIE